MTRKAIQAALGSALLIAVGALPTPWWRDQGGHGVPLLNSHGGQTWWSSAVRITFFADIVLVACLVACVAVYVVRGRAWRGPGFLGVVACVVGLIAGGLVYFGHPPELVGHPTGGFLATCISAPLGFLTGVMFARGKVPSPAA